MSATRHRISKAKLDALKAGLDDQGRISVDELARIFGEPNENDPERSELEIDREDRLYVAYCAAVGDDVVELPPEELARIRARIAKGEQVAREIAAEREQEVRDLAAEERREIAEADRLWPAYQAAIGPTGGYE